MDVDIQGAVIDSMRPAACDPSIKKPTKRRAVEMAVVGIFLGFNTIAMAQDKPVAENKPGEATPAVEPPPPPKLQLPEPTGDFEEERLASPPDARVETYFAPELFRPWVLLGIGADLRVSPQAKLNFASDLALVWPFFLWQGTAPGFFPLIDLGYRSSGRLSFSAGFGLGVFENGHGYRDAPKGLFYVPQINLELAGTDAKSPGFRHDIVFKPDTPYIDLGHVILPGNNATLHELRLIIGLDFMEAFL